MLVSFEEEKTGRSARYVAIDVGHFLWSQLVQLRIWFARNAVPALWCA